jgi:probable phosphoglycerate mutase
VTGALTAFIDGGARGNPGPAGWGARIQTETGDVAAELRGALPYATNNVAEYTGLIEALKWCAEQGTPKVQVKSDSLLLVQQMRGVYKVKNEALRRLHGEARLIAARLAGVTYEHIPREQNADADRLANQAMDEAKT